MATIKEQSLNISSAVSELEKLLANIKRGIIMNNPEFVHRSPLSENEEYIKWLNSIKQRFSAYQVKATVKVNAEMLAFYWSLGRDMVEKDVEHTYGKGIIENLSLDLRRMFKGQAGFSTVNLYYMKRWYAFYKASNEIFLPSW